MSDCSRQNSCLVCWFEMRCVWSFRRKHKMEPSGDAGHLRKLRRLVHRISSAPLSVVEPSTPAALQNLQKLRCFGFPQNLRCFECWSSCSIFILLAHQEQVSPAEKQQQLVCIKDGSCGSITPRIAQNINIAIKNNW